MNPETSAGGSVADRRFHVRLDVVGRLRGTFDTTAIGQLINIGPGGALVASPVRLLRDAVHTITAEWNGYHFRIDTRVRHVCQVAGSVAPQFEIGLEFLNAPETLLALLAEG